MKKLNSKSKKWIINSDIKKYYKTINNTMKKHKNERKEKNGSENLIK